MHISHTTQARARRGLQIAILACCKDKVDGVPGWRGWAPTGYLYKQADSICWRRHMQQICICSASRYQNVAHGHTYIQRGWD